MIYMLMTFGGRKNVKQRESKKIKERRIKERKRGPGVKLESKGKMNKIYIYIHTHNRSAFMDRDIQVGLGFLLTPPNHK